MCGSFKPCDGAVTEGPPPTCTPTSATQSITKEGTKDGQMPPVVMTVDFGDGSGEQKWDRDSPHDVWTHKYSKPGMYTIFVMCKFNSISDTATFIFSQKW